MDSEIEGKLTIDTLDISGLSDAILDNLQDMITILEDGAELSFEDFLKKINQATVLKVLKKEYGLDEGQDEEEEDDE